MGIGAPGAIEPDTGVIKYWSNLDFTNVPITALMKARLDKEILLENDANAAALGEYAAGAGKGSQSMVAVTLGTGVGGGAILNGKLYTGFNYAGMEIGHFVIEHGGRLCTCGRRGCFEAYCSATALIKRTRQVMEEDRTSRLWELAGSLEGVNGPPRARSSTSMWTTWAAGWPAWSTSSSRRSSASAAAPPPRGRP